MSARVLLSLAVSTLIACSASTGPSSFRGQWGGPSASLVLTDSTGTVSYACGAGTIDAGWSVDRSGQLRATGQHYTGGGPLPITGRPPHPARYVGVLRGNTLTLTVLLLDTGDTLGPFPMRRGGPIVAELCV